MKNLIALIFSLLLINTANAEIFDICEAILPEFNKLNINKVTKNSYLGIYDNPGINFKQNFLHQEKIYYKELPEQRLRPLYRNENNNPFIDFVTNKARGLYEVGPGDELLEVNDIPIANLSDDEFYSLTDAPKEFKLKFYSQASKSIKIKNIKPIRDEYMLIPLDVEEDMVNEVDTKKSEFHANITLSSDIYVYEIMFPELINFIDSKWKEHKNLTNNTNLGFSCVFDDEIIKKYRFPNPEIIFYNQQSPQAQANAKIEHRLSYYGEEKYFRLNTRVSIKNGIFNNEFNFRVFPFDSQKLSYKFYLSQSGHNIYPLISTGAPEFLQNIRDIKVSEWQHSYADYASSQKWIGGFERYIVSFDHYFERNATYYLTKIVLPILVILFISWSVFWINPKELEARLTVTIVCLLSLIAYTFVIDNDIPKLSYLTFMDYLVLLSYIFSVIPTIQTIYVHITLNETRTIENAIALDKKFRKYTGLSYFIILTLLFLALVQESPNVIKSLAFLRG